MKCPVCREPEVIGLIRCGGCGLNYNWFKQAAKKPVIDPVPETLIRIRNLIKEGVTALKGIEKKMKS